MNERLKNEIERETHTQGWREREAGFVYSSSALSKSEPKKDRREEMKQREGGRKEGLEAERESKRPASPLMQYSVCICVCAQLNICACLCV